MPERRTRNEAAILALVAIGALNWGMVGLLNTDLVASVFGRRSLLSRLVYMAVGIAGALLVLEMFGGRAKVSMLAETGRRALRRTA